MAPLTRSSSKKNVVPQQEANAEVEPQHQQEAEEKEEGEEEKEAEEKEEGEEEEEEEEDNGDDDEEKATHFVVRYTEGHYAIFPVLVVNEATFWEQRGWQHCARCVSQDLGDQLAELEGNGDEEGEEGGGGGGGGGWGVDGDGKRKCQCTLDTCGHDGGGGCTKWQQCATRFCSNCQVENGCGCQGIPGQDPPCTKGRQAKTALERWSCAGCARALGLLMRYKITKILARPGEKKKKVVLLFAHAYAPTGTEVAECGVSARFAGFHGGRMCSETDMAGHPNPVGNTKDWVVAIWERVMPHQHDVPSCAKIHVEEEGGQVTDVRILDVQAVEEAEGGGGGQGGEGGGVWRRRRQRKRRRKGKGRRRRRRRRRNRKRRRRRTEVVRERRL